MNKKTFEELTLQCESFEKAHTGPDIDYSLPLVARLEGQAFTAFTKSLKQPFDERFANLMGDVTKALIAQHDAIVGYTQTNEITLMWAPVRAKYPLDSQTRFQRMASLLAGTASAKFNRLLVSALPEKESAMPIFDCHVWNVPSIDDALDTLIWREKNAISKSVEAAASTRFSNMQLEGKSLLERREMLLEKGVNWNDYPTWAQRGRFFHRVCALRELTAEELARIPANHRPTGPIQRNSIEHWDLPPLTNIKNLQSVIFNSANPILKPIPLKPTAPVTQNNGSAA